MPLKILKINRGSVSPIDINEVALKEILDRLHKIAVEEEEKLIFTKQEAERIKKQYQEEDEDEQTTSD